MELIEKKSLFRYCEKDEHDKCARDILTRNFHLACSCDCHEEEPDDHGIPFSKFIDVRGEHEEY